LVHMFYLVLGSWFLRPRDPSSDPAGCLVPVASRLVNHDDEGGFTGANWTSVVHLGKKVQIFFNRDGATAMQRELQPERSGDGAAGKGGRLNIGTRRARRLCAFEMTLSLGGAYFLTTASAANTAG
jgi:hypothetical protein